MKRDFLKAMGLPDDQIEQIMAEHGKTVQSHQQAITAKDAAHASALAAKDNEISGLSTQIGDRDKDLNTLKEQLAAANGDAQKLADAQKQLADWQTKYEKDTQELKNATEAERKKFALEKFLSGVEFASEFAKNGVLAELEKKDFPVKDGKLYGAEEWLTEIKKSDPSAFKAVDTPPAGADGDTQPGADGAPPPADGTPPGATQTMQPAPLPVFTKPLSGGAGTGANSLGENPFGFNRLTQPPGTNKT